MRISLIETYKNNEKNVIFIEPGGKLPTVKSATSTSKDKSLWAPILSIGKEIFLPEGFPESVHPDYIPYQIWDTVQAFASTIMGTLTTHSIMRGVGVGESTATPLAAAVTWILKDGTGMIGRIVFAWWNGTDLDGQCKKWRLFADILNDVAMGIELLIPYISSYSTLVLCVSTAMKSVVGVAGGATRAALTQHQALRNNLADVSAKDGSQETCVNLIASLLGIFILSIFHDGQYLLELYLLLVAVHLYANYSAVKALKLNTLNEDRLALIIKKYLTNGEFPHPDEVNKEESVLLFRRPSREICGFDIKMGASLGKLVKDNVIPSSDIEFILKHFHSRKYLLAADIKRHKIYVILTKDIESSEVIQAYFHACFCGLFICMILKRPVDILLKADMCRSSYPLMHLYVYSKKYVFHTHNNISSLASDCICETDTCALYEYEIFINCLAKKGWIFESNLLSIDAWRFSWND